MDTSRITRNWLMLASSLCIFGSGSALSLLVWNWVPTAIAASLMTSMLGVGLVSNNFEELFRQESVDEMSEEEALIVLLEELEELLNLMCELESENESAHTRIQ